jgi:hypothetical protein
MPLLSQLYKAGNSGYLEDYLAMEASGGASGHAHYQGISSNEVQRAPSAGKGG